MNVVPSAEAIMHELTDHAPSTMGATNNLANCVPVITDQNLGPSFHPFFTICKLSLFLLRKPSGEVSKWKGLLSATFNN
jgi:hypothetical protein